MRSCISWDGTPCSPFKDNRHFGLTYHLHLQDLRTSKARNQREAGSKERAAYGLLYSGFLLGLFFDFEDGSDMFLRSSSLKTCSMVQYLKALVS
jgi:hypothetical protein